MRLAVLLIALLVPLGAARAERDPDAEIAHGHFTRGRTLFQRGEFRASLVEFEAARKAKRLAAFDFNIARCHEELGQIDAAITAYEAYLSQTVGQDSAEVRRHVEELRQRPRPASPTAPVVLTPAVSPAPVVVRPARSTRSVVAPSVVAGAAVATLIVGSALYGTVAADFNDLQDSCAPRCERSSWRGLDQRATAAYALWGVTGALVVADAVLWGLWARERRHGTQRAWRVAPSSGSVAVGAAF